MRTTARALALLGLVVALPACERSEITSPLGVARCGRTLRAVRMQVWGSPPVGEPVDLVDHGARFTLRLYPGDHTFTSTFAYRTVNITTSGVYWFCHDCYDRIFFSHDPFSVGTYPSETSYRYLDMGRLVFLRDVNAVLDVEGNGYQDCVSMEIVLEGCIPEECTRSCCYDCGSL